MTDPGTGVRQVLRPLLNPVTWWGFNIALVAFWLGVATVSGVWFIAIGAVLYVGVLFLVEPPGTSRGNGDDGAAETPTAGWKL
jgi:hypothetical protein